ncbi:MAG: spermidine synthase [Thiolinea sp.]
MLRSITSTTDFAMPDQRILYQTQDDLGPLLVLDDGEQRTLAFAEGDTQSCCLKNAPYIPQYEYTQAMLLVLLFCQPKRVTLLGLGGGNLFTTLHKHIPGIHITAIELRQRVIDIAYQYFQLPRGKRLQVIQQNGVNYLVTNTARRADIIFADLYHADGVDSAQLQAGFIRQCAANLKTHGWLVLNCWTEHQNEVNFISLLHELFTDVRAVHTGSKNWVILAGKIADKQSVTELRNKATRLSATMEFPLSRHLGRLQHLK